MTLPEWFGPLTFACLIVYLLQVGGLFVHIFNAGAKEFWWYPKLVLAVTHAAAAAPLVLYYLQLGQGLTMAYTMIIIVGIGIHIISVLGYFFMWYAPSAVPLANVSLLIYFGDRTSPRSAKVEYASWFFFGLIPLAMLLYMGSRYFPPPPI